MWKKWRGGGGLRCSGGSLVACCLMAIFSGMDLLVFFYTNTCKIMLLYGQSQPVSEVAERCRFMTMLCRLIILTLLFNEN